MSSYGDIYLHIYVSSSFPGVTSKFLGIGKKDRLINTKNAFQRYLCSIKCFEIPGTVASRGKVSGKV